MGNGYVGKAKVALKLVKPRKWPVNKEFNNTNVRDSIFQS